MKILCATDFGDRARLAARIAVALAQRTSGSVELLHVVPPAATNVVALAADSSVFDQELRRDAQARLAAECRELATGGVDVTSWLAEGEVDSALSDRAAAMNADLIVMGAHSRPALERFILGSAAERTVRRAERPVLIVPPGATFPLPPQNGKGRLHVVVAVDGRADGRGALEFVRSLRRWVVCDVTVLRLYWPPEEYGRLGLVGAHDLTKPDPDVTADLTRSLTAEVGVLPGTGNVTLAVEAAWGDPASAILECTRERHADLVVMGGESRHGLARVTHTPVASRVARQASGVPVVFAPTPAAIPGPTAMSVVHTVLVPTDLSVAGNRAVGYAYGLLAPRGGVIELCHVHERALPSPPYVYERPQGKLTDADRARLSAELWALVPADADRLGIVTHVSVIDGGKAAEAILQAAERLRVDAIVLGSRGKGTTYRALLGSVSEEVLHHARRPVLVVPRSSEAS